jgi:hypothetical protein
MAEKTGNEKLAIVLTGLSCLLVAEMVWDQFGFLQGREHLTHVQRLNMERVGRQADERSMWAGDRRR